MCCWNSMRKGKRMRQKKIFEDIIAEIFQIWLRDTYVQVQEAQQITNRINTKKNQLVKPEAN